QNSPRDVLICIFQRGGADGLNMVVPHGDKDYYAHRASLAIPQPGVSGAAIDLDGFFGLHPALDALKEVWAGRRRDRLVCLLWATPGAGCTERDLGRQAAGGRACLRLARPNPLAF